MITIMSCDESKIFLPRSITKAHHQALVAKVDKPETAQHSQALVWNSHSETQPLPCSRLTHSNLGLVPYLPHLDDVLVASSAKEEHRTPLQALCRPPYHATVPEKPAAEKPAERPAAEKPAAEKPAA